MSNTNKQKALLFQFEELTAKSSAVKTIQKELARLGTPAQVEIDPSPKRKSGISYKTIVLVFSSSSQTVSLGVKKTGDIFEVKLNGKPLPIKNQDNQKAAIKEISDAVTKNAPRWQKVLQRRKVVPADTKIKVSRKKQEEVLTERETELDRAIKEATERRDQLAAEKQDLDSKIAAIQAA